MPNGMCPVSEEEKLADFMRPHMSDQEIRKWIAKTYLSSDSVTDQGTGRALLAMLDADRSNRRPL